MKLEEEEKRLRQLEEETEKRLEKQMILIEGFERVRTQEIKSLEVL